MGICVALAIISQFGNAAFLGPLKNPQRTKFGNSTPIEREKRRGHWGGGIYLSAAPAPSSGRRRYCGPFFSAIETKEWKRPMIHGAWGPPVGIETNGAEGGGVLLHLSALIVTKDITNTNRCNCSADMPWFPFLPPPSSSILPENPWHSETRVWNDMRVPGPKNPSRISQESLKNVSEMRCYQISWQTIRRYESE